MQRRWVSIAILIHLVSLAGLSADEEKTDQDIINEFTEAKKHFDKQTTDTSEAANRERTTPGKSGNDFNSAVDRLVDGVSQSLDASGREAAKKLDSKQVASASKKALQKSDIDLENSEKLLTSAKDSTAEPLADNDKIRLEGIVKAIKEQREAIKKRLARIDAMKLPDSNRKGSTAAQGSSPGPANKKSLLQAAAKKDTRVYNMNNEVVGVINPDGSINWGGPPRADYMVKIHSHREGEDGTYIWHKTNSSVDNRVIQNTNIIEEGFPDLGVSQNSGAVHPM